MGKILQDMDDTYECQQEWPENCHLQYGSTGIVFTGSREQFEETLNNPLTAIAAAVAPEAMQGLTPSPYYTTAFFEAFPRDPRTFLRGEGETVAAAEQAAWEQWQNILACPGHEFEARGYTNGLGFCRHCNMSQSEAIPPTLRCFSCQEPTYPYGNDALGQPYCEPCYKALPDDQLSESSQDIRKHLKRMRDYLAKRKAAEFVIQVENLNYDAAA